MEEDIIHLNVAIGEISKELIGVQKALEDYRSKQARKEAPDAEAIAFVEKAEQVLDKAESGEIKLTPDQIRRIRNNLVKILKTFQK